MSELVTRSREKASFPLPSMSGSASQDLIAPIELYRTLFRATPTERRTVVGRIGELASTAQMLFDARADLKTRTASVAMHLQDDWRRYIFRQLDNLLDEDEWQTGDLVPQAQSYLTFLRMLLYLNPLKKPGLGLTQDGLIVVA